MGQTPGRAFTQAVAAGDVEGVGALLERRRVPDPGGAGSATGRSEYSELTSHREYHNTSPLWVAAEAGHTQIVKVLIDASERELLEPDSFGCLPCHRAVQCGERDREWLMSCAAHPCCRTARGRICADSRGAAGSEGWRPQTGSTCRTRTHARQYSAAHGRRVRACGLCPCFATQRC